MSLHIVAEACECISFCKAEVENMSECVQYMAREGIVSTKYCKECKGATWHFLPDYANSGEDAECLSCKRRKQERKLNE